MKHESGRYRKSSFCRDQRNQLKANRELLHIVQKIVDIDESEDLARINWRNFSNREKLKTMDIYNLLNRENDGEEST